MSNQLNLKSLQELTGLLKTSNYLDIEQLLEAVSTRISVKLSTPDARQQFCNNRDFLRSIGLAELPRELSVLVGSKIASHSGLRIYLLNHCSVKCKQLKGHTGCVYSAEFNNLGDKVVSASDDGTVRIWDVESGNCLKMLEGHTDWVYSAEFNKAGDKVVSRSDDGTVRIWDISELNAIDRYLQRDVTIEQALFLMCAYEAMQNGDQQLDCRNFPWLLAYYDSFPDCIQRILIETNSPPSLRRLLRRLGGAAIELLDPDQYGLPIIGGALVIGLVGWELMKRLSRK